MDDSKKQMAMQQRGKINNQQAPVESNSEFEFKVKQEGKQQLSRTKNLIESFINGAGGNPSGYDENRQRLTEEMTYNNTLNEAIHTQPVQHQGNHGYAIGNHAVFPEKNAQGKTRYTVANMDNGAPIYEQLRLSSTAECMVRLLNRGYSKYSPEISKVLEFEQRYEKYYNDAKSFAKRSKQSGRDQLLETRFEEAKHQAKLVKEEAERHLKRLS